QSEEEVDVLVQRVVKDINNALKKNPNIATYRLIPCPEARYNRSPIVLVENKLGVESWCIKFLLPYVHNKLLLYRQRKLWLDKDALIDITCTLLLLNPDFTTAWNYMLLKCFCLFAFCSYNLIFFPFFPVACITFNCFKKIKIKIKSGGKFFFRRWVLQSLIQECCLRKACKERSGAGAVTAVQTERLQRILQEEMKACSEAAGRYPSNYNAWSHRIWVIQNLAKDNKKVFLDELSSMKYWVSMHVSDHSGFHYGQFLLISLVGDPGHMLDKIASALQSTSNEHCASLPKEEEASAEIQRTMLPDLFDEELELCIDLIESHPGHETLWCHRRYVFFLWHHWNNKQGAPLNSSDRPLDNSSATTGGKSAQAMDPNKPVYTQETKRLKWGPLQCCQGLPTEHRFITKTLTDCRSTEQARFAIAYRKWLDSVLGQ
ncbi:protein prenyltransferase alpha subunit repeat-containing protein 1-like, partial [Acipenser oxyrinchus oxyrinchus]